MTLALKSDLYFCLSNDKAVFLDLTADRYFCLPPELEPGFSKLFKGTETQDNRDENFAALMATGLFIPSDQPFSLLPAANCITPTRSAVESRFHDWSFGTVVLAGVSQLVTTCHLRFVTLASVVTRLRRKKERAQKPVSDLSAAQTRRLHTFLAMRRLIPAQNRCLQRSIALFEFLASAGICPLVIGVRMQPFAAHAWLQAGDLVLNDYVDEVRLYTPILVI